MPANSAAFPAGLTAALERPPRFGNGLGLGVLAGVRMVTLRPPRLTGVLAGLSVGFGLDRPARLTGEDGLGLAFPRPPRLAGGDDSTTSATSAATFLVPRLVGAGDAVLDASTVPFCLAGTGLDLAGLAAAFPRLPPLTATSTSGGARTTSALPRCLPSGKATFGEAAALAGALVLVVFAAGVLAGLASGFGLDRPARLTGEAGLGLAFARPPRLAGGDDSTTSATSAAAFLVPRLVGAGEAGLDLAGLTAAFPRLPPLTTTSTLGEDGGARMTVVLPRRLPAGDFAFAAGEAALAGVSALVVLAAGGLAGLLTGFALDRPARFTGEAGLGLAFPRLPRLARGDDRTASAISPVVFLVPRLVGAGEMGVGLAGLAAAFPRLPPLTATSTLGEDGGGSTTVVLPRRLPAGEATLAAALARVLVLVIAAGGLAGLSMGFGLDRPARLTGDFGLGLAFLRPPRLARGDDRTASATSAAAFLVPRLVGAGEAGLVGLTAAFPRRPPLTATSISGEDSGVRMTVALPRRLPAGDFALAVGEATLAGEAALAGVMDLVALAAGEVILAGVDFLAAGDLGLAASGVANRR